MHRHPRHAAARGQLEHREHVRLVAVHAAGRKQAHHVQGAAAGQHRVAGGVEFGVVEEAGVLDRRVDPGQVLVDDAAGADVHVPDFGIAHLPVRQADVAAFGVDQGGRMFGQQPAPGGHVGLGDGVVGGIVAVAPAIEDQQDDGAGAVGAGGGGWHGRESR